ncbi:YbgA family protein [Bowmanella dokdonensis]|uniref:DUF1722 domain-containing protein n=1 Tax=Bowmanella dokdonensis TaxID=751969 RepID=A0A939ILP7_9ALTE|nr:DUF523 and DUF1722 domain-containing protein [Bowmanella dokdonensis]MBN7824443.1 DUF1722 domain-containing protein [Bowmanella dokdonensis]
MSEFTQPRIGVSACVLGDKVRYDGGHKRSAFVAAQLADFFTFKPICPEVGMGLPVPRPTIHLRETDAGLRLTDSRSGDRDHTAAMEAFFTHQTKLLSSLDGYILAAKSPSCGMERIKVYDQSGSLVHRQGQGLFASLLRRRFPHLPLEEDGRLNDAGLRESFITRVYAYHGFRHQVLIKPSVAALVTYHSRNKLLVMAYSPQTYQSLGRLVAKAKGRLESTLEEYQSLLFSALGKPTDRRKQTNALMHLQGYFKRKLSRQDKQELSEQIEKYRLGHVPLLAPMTLLRHHLKHYPNSYLQQQSYLQPYPEALGLRA